MSTAEIVVSLLALAAKLEPAVVDLFRHAKSSGTLPDSLRDAADKLDPANVFDDAQKQLDMLPKG